MPSRPRTYHSQNTGTSDLSNAAVQGMFQSRPFVMQPQATEKSEQQPDLKGSLMRAERYGHHLGQIQAASVSFPTAVQPKMGTGQPIQLVKSKISGNKKPKNPLGLKVDTRRVAGGYKNPPHEHGNMLPLYKDAALSPQPQNRKEKDWLMSPNRRFNTYTPTHTQPPKEVKGHENTVMGHAPDAVTHWNQTGHTQSRAANSQHNRETSSYHGLEDRASSDASGGATTERYRSPSPSIGSHESHYNVKHPNFNPKVPWKNRLRKPDGAGGWDKNVSYDPNKNKWI